MWAGTAGGRKSGRTIGEWVQRWECRPLEQAKSINTHRRAQSTEKGVSPGEADADRNDGREWKVTLLSRVAIIMQLPTWLSLVVGVLVTCPLR